MESENRSECDVINSTVVVESEEFVHISRELKRKMEVSMLEKLAPLCGIQTALVRYMKHSLVQPYI